MTKKFVAVFAGVLILGLVSLGITLKVTQSEKPAQTAQAPSKINDTKTSKAPVVYADRQGYSSLKDLKKSAEVVLVGTVEKRISTNNLSRDVQDPSKENTEFPVYGTDYEVSVNAYLKGAGEKNIIVIQEETQDRTPMEIGEKYIFFLNHQAGKYMFGGEPYKFKVSNGKVKVDSAKKTTQQIFKEKPEKDFLAELNQ